MSRSIVPRWLSAVPSTTARDPSKKCTATGPHRNNCLATADWLLLLPNKSFASQRMISEWLRPREDLANFVSISQSEPINKLSQPQIARIFNFSCLSKRVLFDSWQRLFLFNLRLEQFNFQGYFTFFIVCWFDEFFLQRSLPHMYQMSTALPWVANLDMFWSLEEMTRRSISGPLERKVALWWGK